MMFIQADNNVDTNFSDFPSDMLSKNKIKASVNLEKKYIDKIESDYSSLIDTFIEHKDDISGDNIDSYIGNAISLD